MNSLQAKLSRALEAAGVAFRSEPSGDLRVESGVAEVGDLVIGFEDGEITTFLGQFTHCHFTPGACGDLDAPDKELECVLVATRFVRELLQDQWVMWAYPEGSGGCYRLSGSDEECADSPLEGEHAAQFVWSGRYVP